MAFEDLDLDEMMKEALEEINGEQDATNDDSESGDEYTGDSSDHGDDEQDRDTASDNEEEDDSLSDTELGDEDGDGQEDGDLDNDNVADSDDTTSDGSEFEPITVKFNGSDIQLDNMAEVQSYLNRVGNTGKPKTSKEKQLMAQSGLSEEDIALMVDAKKGNKGAIAKLAKNANVDVYDLDDEMAESYTPEFQAQYMSEVDEVAEEIMSNENLAREFQEVTKTLPEDFIGAIASNPVALRNFAQHVESGLAKEVLPQAMKKVLLEGGDLLTHYTTLGEAAFNSNREKPSDSKTTRKLSPRAGELKKQATKKKVGQSKKKTTLSADDVWNMSDEDFAKEFKLS